MKRILLLLFIYVPLSCFSQVETPVQSSVQVESMVKPGVQPPVQSATEQPVNKTGTPDTKENGAAVKPKTEAELKAQIKVLKQDLKNKRLESEIEVATKEVLLAGKFDELQADEVRIYNANVLTTNFSIPLARFNFTHTSQDKTKKGDILLFNSIGAGVSWNWGVYEATTNGKKKIIKEEFSNIIGGQIGFLFSAGTGKDSIQGNKNVFAPVVNLVLLDFQVGFGYELGSIQPNQKRTFLTLSYAIPLYKLSKTGFYIINKRYKKSIVSDTDESLQAAKIKVENELKVALEQVNEIQKKVADTKKEADDAKASAKAAQEETIAANEELKKANQAAAEAKIAEANAKGKSEIQAAEAKIAAEKKAVDDAKIKVFEALQAEAKANEEAKAKITAEANAQKEAEKAKSKVEEANTNKILIENKSIMKHNNTGGFGIQ